MSKLANALVLALVGVALAGDGKVVEEETGKKFDAVVAGTGEDVKLVCTGTACREKTMFAVNVYAIAHWIDAKGGKEALKKWKGKTGKQVRDDQDFFDALCSADIEKRFRLVFVRDVEAEKVRDAFKESLVNVYGKNLPKVARDFIMLWRKELKDGHTIELRSLPGGTIEARLNDKKIGTFEKDKKFADAVWKIWFQKKVADDYLKAVKKGLVSRISALW